jgi:hypothetical protein
LALHTGPSGDKLELSFQIYLDIKSIRPYDYTTRL